MPTAAHSQRQSIPVVTVTSDEPTIAVESAARAAVQCDVDPDPDVAIYVRRSTAIVCAPMLRALARQAPDVARELLLELAAELAGAA